MPRVTCIECQGEIPPDDVNVGEGVAYCRSCGTLTRLAEIAGSEVTADEAESLESRADPEVPPPGCALIDDGVATIVRASARSVSTAIGVLVMAAFWNGIVSIFVLLALGGTWFHIFGPLPSWFPGPFGHGGNPGMPLGMVIFLWIFLTPFISIGLMLIGMVLTAMFGRTEVRLRGADGVAMTGFGPFTWKRRFDAADVKAVRVGRTTWKQNDEAKPVVTIECKSGRTIRVGTLLHDDRRAWMVAVLRVLLVPNEKR